jgi:preprotein translocase subunit YajC
MLIVVYVLVLVAAFFFLIVLPQRRRMAAHNALMAALTVGDEVITAGGIHGTIRAVEDTTLSLEVAPGVVITIARGAVASLVGLPPGPALDEGPVDEIDGGAH